jgi:hypothetical protein
MSEFDPYHRWLGIAPHDQPPHHYRLLGLSPFEADADVIDAASSKQMVYLRGCTTGPHAGLSQKLLNEVATARLCLLDPEKKKAYDEKLKASLDKAERKSKAAKQSNASRGTVPLRNNPPWQGGHLARNKDDDFDGYRKWLGIPETKRPPTHYQLLAVSLDEDDHEVIRAAAEQRRHYVGSKRGEGHDAEVTEIVFRINEAEATLLNQEMRRDYDRQMRLFEKRRKKRQVDPFASRSDAASPSRMGAGEDTGIVKTFAGIMAVIVVGFGVMAWFSFQLPWLKPPQQVEAAAQPPVPVAAPVQVAQLPEKPLVVEPQPKQVIPQPAEDTPVAPVKQDVEDENHAELIAIPELSPFTGFWISDDGLTIYFDKKGGEIWSAHRNSTEARFTNEKSMQLNGRQPTLSADELEIIFLSERSDRKRGELFYVAKRDAKDGAFRRPAEVTELLDKSGITTYKNACLSADGRTLTFNSYTGDNSSLQTTIRPTRKARWPRPTSLPHKADQHSNLSWPFVSANGRLLLCFEAQDKQNRLTAWHRNNVEEPFSYHQAVSLPGTETISGRCPRYVAATNELFFLRFIEPTVFQLSCIRNFTPTLPIAAKLQTAPMVVGIFDIIWDEAGKRGTSNYQFKKTNEVLKGDREIGTWQLRGDKVVITFLELQRGKVEILFDDNPNTFHGVHTWSNGKVSKWTGVRLK